MMATTTTTTTTGAAAAPRGFTESSQSEHRPDTMADKGLPS
jgi:hypothetical protein